MGAAPCGLCMAGLHMDFSSALRQRDQELLTLHQAQISELQAQVESGQWAV